MSERRSKAVTEKDKDKSANSVDSLRPVIYQIPFPDTDCSVTGQQRTPCYKDQFPVTNLSQEIAMVHACCTAEVPSPKNKQTKTTNRRREKISKKGKESKLQHKTTDVKEDNDVVCPRHEVKIEHGLPLLDTELTNHSHHRLNGKDPQYTEVFKASLKLKGLRIEKIFAKDRSSKAKSRKTNHIEAIQEKEQNDWDKEDDWKYISLPDVKLSHEVVMEDISSRSIKSNVNDLENSIVENGGSTNRSIDSSKPNADFRRLFANNCSPSRSSPRVLHNRTLDKHLPRVISRIMDRYEDTPGRKIKYKIYGRKLGNVVSSERLHQLLNSKQPLKMENFYNYYPQEQS